MTNFLIVGIFGLVFMLTVLILEELRFKRNRLTYKIYEIKGALAKGDIDKAHELLHEFEDEDEKK